MQKGMMSAERVVRERGRKLQRTHASHERNFRESDVIITGGGGGKQGQFIKGCHEGDWKEGEDVEAF